MVGAAAHAARRAAVAERAALQHRERRRDAAQLSRRGPHRHARTASRRRSRRRRSSSSTAIRRSSSASSRSTCSITSSSSIAQHRLGIGRALARSRTARPASRVFATPRALALSYVESYVDFTGGIKAYAVVDLRVMGDVRLAAVGEECVEGRADAARLAASAARPRRRAKIAAMRRRYRRFREAHGYKPWKYYKGRERWTPLPPEFARARRDRSASIQIEVPRRSW